MLRFAPENSPTLRVVPRESQLMAALMLDTKGLNCPLPILKTKKTLKDIAVGESLEVFATDPSSDRDFRAFCRSTGHELLEAENDGDVFRFLIKRTK